MNKYVSMFINGFLGFVIISVLISVLFDHYVELELFAFFSVVAGLLVVKLYQFVECLENKREAAKENNDEPKD